MSSNGLNVLISNSHLGIIYSKDGGQTVNKPKNPSEIRGGYKNVILSKDGNNAVVLSADNGVWYSRNGGESWAGLSDNDRLSIYTSLSVTGFNTAMSGNRDCSRIILGSNANPTQYTINSYSMNRGLLYLDIA